MKKSSKDRAIGALRANSHFGHTDIRPYGRMDKAICSDRFAQTMTTSPPYQISLHAPGQRRLVDLRVAWLLRLIARRKMSWLRKEMRN